MNDLLVKLSNDELTSKLRDLKGKEDILLVDILEHINEFERRNLALQLGYPGIYAYLTKCLGYSDGEAFRRLESARLLNTTPEIRPNIVEGRLNLTNMSEVRNAMRANQKATGRSADKKTRLEYIGAVLDCTKREAQKNLASLVPAMNTHFQERHREHHDGSLELTLLLLSPQKQRLIRARDLLSHKGPLTKFSEVIDSLSEYYLKKKDLTQSFDPDKETAGQKKLFGRVPISIRRAVFRRDRGRCQYKNENGKACNSSYQIEVDHIKPVSAGGTNELENLQCLCRAHNQWKADRVLN